MTQILGMLFYLFSMLVLLRVLMSWVPMDPYHPVARFIYNSTEPFLRPIREVLPPTAGMDFSPLILMILVSFIANILLGS